MEGRQILISKLSDIPTSPGIYKMLDAMGKILYIGKAKNLQKRVSDYTKKDLALRTARMVFLVKNLDYVVTSSEAEALLLEANMIKQVQPQFNILLKDDKSFPYIKLDMKHDFPKIVKYRGKISDDGDLYYGPFASGYNVDLTLTELEKIFFIRSCSDYYFATRKRPCLLYQIKRCSAPCVNKISQDLYGKLVKQVQQFLSGQLLELQNNLSVMMQEHSVQLEYEKAAEVRDRIKLLTKVQMQSSLLNSGVKNADVIVSLEYNDQHCVQVFFYRAGQHYGHKTYFPQHTNNCSRDEVVANFIGQFYQRNKSPELIILEHNINDAPILEKALLLLHKTSTKIIAAKKPDHVALVKRGIENTKIALENKTKALLQNHDNLVAIQNLFELSKIPERIEIYDNSHLMGQYGVGVMVVSGPEGFMRNEYRTYNTNKAVKFGGDDYQMLREVLNRRLAKLAGSNMPDLLIIDGGKGHLSVTQEIMQSHNCDIKFVCMSKGVDRNAGKEVFHRPQEATFTLDKGTKLMKYLQILRDEAHNFAINTHRKKRLQSLKDSELNDLNNIGEKRKMLLLRHFGSIDAIKDATFSQLSNIPGIGPKIANSIFESLHRTKN
jgi:excinuclease ABC subunit C